MSDRSASVFARELIAGGGSTAIVSAVLNPVDVVKTRRQLEAYRDARALSIAAQLYAEGGVVALWRPGLAATFSRELVYSGCTKGFYPVARDAICGGAEPTLPQRVLAASCTGLMGSLCANALDVVKIRQFENPDRYASFFAALRDIANSEGVVGGLLIRGASASAPRGAAIAVGEVTTYDFTKDQFRKRDYEDNFALHVATSLITGIVATTVAAPFDLLKSRVMASDLPTDTFATVLARLLRKEGPAALFNGWLPTYCRLGPHACLTFPLLEAMRKALGLEYM